ncbi:MAG: hypothetical protein SGILL_008274, partial [Bacillariaceae sp.]
MTASFSLDRDDPYYGFTVWFIITVITIFLFYLIIPVTLWVRHKRLYAHYNTSDHLRELELAKWKDNNDDDGQEEEAHSNQDSTSRGSGDDARDSTAQGGEVGRQDSTTRDENFGDSSGGQDAQAAQQQQVQQINSTLQEMHNESYLAYYYNSFWSRQLQPDQAMRQLLVLWYCCCTILIVGMCLCTAYRKSVSDTTTMNTQMSDYFGAMKVVNTTVVPVESIERFRFTWFRTFEARVKLEVEWQCEDVSLDEKWQCDATLFYESCSRSYNCHEYLIGQVKEESENITDPATEYCLEEDKNTIIADAQECFRTEVGHSTHPFLTLYGDCNACQAFERIPSTSTKSQERLKYNGTFFMVMGGVAMVWWIRTQRRYKERRFPKPPEWSSSRNLNVEDEESSSEDSGSDNDNGGEENQGNNTPAMQARRRRTRRNSSLRRSSNDPIQNRMDNEASRRRQRSLSPSNPVPRPRQFHSSTEGGGNPQELMSVVARHYQRGGSGG